MICRVVDWYIDATVSGDIVDPIFKISVEQSNSDSFQTFVTTIRFSCGRNLESFTDVQFKPRKIIGVIYLTEAATVVPDN